MTINVLIADDEDNLRNLTYMIVESKLESQFPEKQIIIHQAANPQELTDLTTDKKYELYILDNNLVKTIYNDSKEEREKNTSFQIWYSKAVSNGERPKVVFISGLPHDLKAQFEEQNLQFYETINSEEGLVFPNIDDKTIPLIMSKPFKPEDLERAVSDYLG